MRFHTVAALYVLIFARFFHFSRGEFLFLLLTISLVLALEAVNTAMEEVCDKVSPEKNEHIRHAKDAAAGAVLIAACFAAVSGVILFWDVNGWLAAWHFYSGHPLNTAALIILSPLSVLYIIFGVSRHPHQKIRYPVRKKREKGKEEK